MVREYKGAFSGEHGDGLVRSEWVGWQFGPRLTRAFEEIKDLFDPGGPHESRQDRPRRRRWTTRRCFAFRPAIAIQPLTDGARLVGVERAERSGRGDADARPAPAAIRRGASPRPSRCATTTATAASSTRERCARATARRATRSTLTRGRANTLRLALSGQLGAEALASEAGARGARPLRELQGLPARVPDRRRHGEDEDRGRSISGSACTGFRCAIG